MMDPIINHGSKERIKELTKYKKTEMKKLNTWVDVSSDSDFSIYNLPFGIFSTAERSPRIGVAIGDLILDLYSVASDGEFADMGIDIDVFSNVFLNDFISLGKPKTIAVRSRIQEWLCDDTSFLAGSQKHFVAQAASTMHMPVKVGDYTDFYSSIEHATNVGAMFRDPDNALLPNWRHLPVGYHGRSSSIIASGVNIHRPKGQTKPNDSGPVFGPSRRLDFELEMAFIIGQATEIGESISIQNAKDHIFGMVLFNDWSARDIQKWEYIPLGPFLAKNFASSISPWIVTIEALAPFAVKGPEQTPSVLPYLQRVENSNYDINLAVTLKPDQGPETVICRSNYKYMYWDMAQQLAHHTVNGCNVNVGDMLASGTISGPTPDSYGSMLELSWGGKKTIALSDGSTRTFIEDNDTVTMRGYAEKEGVRVGFGEVSTKVLPAK